jgi:hypothetical protein
MKKLFYLLIPAMFFFACNNAETKKGDEKCCDNTEDCSSTCKDMVTVDSLLANLESFVDKEVKVCGKCSHVCQESGRNIFLTAPDVDSLMVIGKAGEGIDKFDSNLAGKNIMLIGTLKKVEVESEDAEVHHEVEFQYYIEVTEAKECNCGGKCSGNNKDAKCCGDKKEGCSGNTKGCGGDKKEGCKHAE